MPVKQLSMLDKGLEIVNLLADVQKPMKVAEIAVRLSMPRTTVYRLLASLEENGFVRRVAPDMSFFLSLRFLKLGELVRESLELRKIAIPIMEKLRDQVNLAVHLVVRDGNDAVYIEKVESKRPVRLFTQVGRRVPLHVTACPRVLLASCPDAEISNYLATTKMVKYTANTVTDPEVLWRLIREIREKGYSIAWGELEPETAAVAAPVRDHQGNVVASLSLAGPEWYFRTEDMTALVGRLQDHAREISSQLGYISGVK